MLRVRVRLLHVERVPAVRGIKDGESGRMVAILDENRCFREIQVKGRHGHRCGHWEPRRGRLHRPQEVVHRACVCLLLLLGVQGRRGRGETAQRQDDLLKTTKWAAKGEKKQKTVEALC